MAAANISNAIAHQLVVVHDDARCPRAGGAEHLVGHVAVAAALDEHNAVLDGTCTGYTQGSMPPQNRQDRWAKHMELRTAVFTPTPWQLRTGLGNPAG